MRLETLGVAYIISTRMYCFETQNPEMNEKERYEGRGRGREGKGKVEGEGGGGEIEGGGREEEGEGERSQDSAWDIAEGGNE